MLCAVNRVPERIHVSGGIVRSEVWAHLLADILQKEIFLSPVQNASSLGGAKLALFAAGEIADLRVRAAESRTLLSPDPAAAGRYDRLYGIYCDLYEKTRPES